ncbi:MAG: hypothetical protein ACRDF0_08735 [Candidatus Limnocylindria bacterium]
MSARAAFVAVAGGVLALVLLLLVVRPAVERGGWSELALVAAMVVGVLLFERWLRTR